MVAISVPRVLWAVLVLHFIPLNDARTGRHVSSDLAWSMVEDETTVKLNLLFIEFKWLWRRHLEFKLVSFEAFGESEMVRWRIEVGKLRRQTPRAEDCCSVLQLWRTRDRLWAFFATSVTLCDARWGGECAFLSNNFRWRGYQMECGNGRCLFVALSWRLRI